MRLKIIFLFLFHFYYAQVHGQQTDLALISQYIATSDSLGNAGDYKNAILFRKKALNLQQVVSPPHYEDLVSNYRTIGYYLRRWGKYSESLFYQKKALELAEDNLKPNSPEIAKSLNGLGSYYYSKQVFDVAFSFFQKALQISLASQLPEVGDYYNNVGIAQQALGDSEAAMETYRLALKHNLATLGFYNNKTADNYDNLGTLYFNLNQFEKAIAHLDSAEFAGMYNNKGAVYNSMGDQRNALNYLEKSLAIYERFGGSNHPETANIYANIGLLLEQKGDWDKALAYFQKALAIRESNFGGKNAAVARTHLYLGNCYLEKMDFENAFDEFQKSLTIYSSLSIINQREVADVRNSLGSYFEKIGNLEEALRQYNEALSTNSVKLGLNDLDVASSYARIGKVYLAQKKYETAREYFEKAKKIRLEVYGENHAEVAESYSLLALSCFGKPDCIKTYLDKAYNAIHYNLSVNPPFEQAYSPIILLKILQAHGDLQIGLFEKYGKSIHLIEADQVFSRAISLINFIKTSLEQPGSRLALLDNYYLIYENAILVKYKLQEHSSVRNYWKDAFTIAEQSNAILLMEAIQSVEAERFAGIPDSLLQLERAYKAELSFLEKSRYEEELKNGNGNLKILQDINNRILDIHAKQHRLMTIFQLNHEEYFKLRYEPKIVSIEKIQHKLLRSDQTMVSYFVGEFKLFVFIISKNQFEMVQIEKNFPLEIWVEEFRTSIYRFNPADKGTAYLNQKLANIGHELYQLIFEPIESKIKTKALVVVPGGVLGYLPFDALLSKPTESYNDFDHFDYLINQYSISYTYSATLLDEMSSGRHLKKPFIAFAPIYHGDTLNVSRSDDPWRTVLGQLRFNVQEATRIHELMGGQIYLDSLATEEKFMEVASKAGILHLATHGKSNDRHGEYSYLAFYQTADSVENELLFVKNLYDIQIPASLVVLSACETGIGELQRGEGIVSLARGFSYAGAASIVTTLWSIDDNASSNIMYSFYQNLKKGLPKDLALRKAKVDYILSNRGNNRTHPLFWAAFVPVGNMESIPSGIPWWGYALTVILLICAIWFWKRKNGYGTKKSVSPLSP